MEPEGTLSYLKSISQDLVANVILCIRTVKFTVEISTDVSTSVQQVNSKQRYLLRKKPQWN